MASTMDLLTLKDIEKGFHGVKVLKGVQFRLRKGEVHALIGENGAGKSTMIKIMAGVHAYDRGEMTFEGRPVAIHSPTDAFRIGISTIHQEFNLIPHLNSASNIFLGREPVNLWGAIDQSKLLKETRKLFDRIGASIDPAAPVNKLGVAEKQMVEICKALSTDAKVIIMDEPTAVLSDKEVRKLFDIIASLKRDGVSVIYVSHKLEELFEISDRITVLRDGTWINTVDTPSINKDDLIRMMIGRQLSDQYPKKDAVIGREILRVEGLTRAGVLRDIGFSIRQGEIVGVSGLVGAGRTEMARAIAGLDPIDAGTVVLDGQAVKPKSPSEAIRQGIVLIPEERKTQGLVLSQTIENNISLPYFREHGRFGIVDRRKTLDAANRLIEELGIRPNDPSKRSRNLSGGNQQKVVIGKWLQKPYKLYIFDEPTRGVDVGAKAEIYRLMNRIAAEGAAIMMISSDLPEILGMSDRILVMKHGEIAGELSRENANEEEVMKYAI